MTTDTAMAKWNQIMADAQIRWERLNEQELAHARGNIQEMIGLLQERYGYNRERAEREMTQFLDQYDGKVYSLARSLPGDVPSKVMHRPWATIATVLGIGVALGFITKPGCSDSKSMRMDAGG
jgi:hypothetical protein